MRNKSRVVSPAMCPSPILSFAGILVTTLSTLFQFGWWLLLSWTDRQLWWTTIDRKLYKIWFEQHYRLHHSPRQNGQDLYLRVGVYPARVSYDPSGIRWPPLVSPSLCPTLSPGCVTLSAGSPMSMCLWVSDGLMVLQVAGSKLLSMCLCGTVCQ